MIAYHFHLFRVYILDSLSQSITTASNMVVKHIQLFIASVCEEAVELKCEAAKVNLITLLIKRVYNSSPGIGCSSRRR